MLRVYETETGLHPSLITYFYYNMKTFLVSYLTLVAAELNMLRLNYIGYNRYYEPRLRCRDIVSWQFPVDDARFQSVMATAPLP